ncbi:MAG: type II toxin-antitoxin system VapC family toxin [Betaproteobacteria bacterium]
MLDTNMCIYLMKNQPVQVADRFAQCYVGEVVMSAITFAELSYGASVSADPKRETKNLSSLIEDIPVMPFDQIAGATYGPIRLATRESKKDHLDKLIAAHAKALSVTLVTNNLKDFEKYPGVHAENWLVWRSATR